MSDIVGRLKPELREIWSSLGGPESVMTDWKPTGCSGEKERLVIL